MKKEVLLTEEKKYTRNSNIEILRIISMLLIIAFHMRRNGYASMEQPFVVYASSTVMGIWGILGVDLFLIISAWFLSSQQFRIKKVIHIIFQTFTWVVFYAVLYVIYDSFRLHNNIISTLYNLLNYTIDGFFKPFWSTYYWFITSYFFMLLLSPFLNKMLNIFDKNKIKKILIIFAFIPIYAQVSTSPVCDIFYFLYVYLLIGYIKIYGSQIIDRYAKKRFCILLIAIIILSQFILYFISLKFSNHSRLFNIISLFINRTIGCVGRHSIILLLLAVLIFFVVLSKKPIHSKIINKIASCCLGVYLFHEAYLFGFPNITNKLCTKLNSAGFMNASFFFPIKYLGIAFILFTVGTILEFFRELIIQRPFMKWFTNKFSYKLNKIDAWFSNI